MKKERGKVGSRDSRLLFLIAIVFIGFNLRPAITSVGPVLGMIRDDIGLAHWSAGLITSLPLISFALMSPLAPKIGRRFGNSRAILLGLFLLSIGIGIRSVPYTPTLFVGTAIIGVGIAILNVLLPAVIKDKYPDKIGRMTGIYSTSMSIFAASASGLSVPLASSFGLGWELALFSWIMLAIIGIIIWITATKTKKDPSNQHPKTFSPTPRELNLWKAPLAWQVTLFMGFQSLLFYAMISWLPEILQSLGFSIVAAGWLVSYAQFIGLPFTFLTPILAERFSNQQGIVLAIGAFTTAGFTGLLFAGPKPLVFLWVTMIGLALGGAISLALTLLGMRSRNAEQAGVLSGMAQSVGYLLAAIGPLFIGVLFDITHTWQLPLIFLVVTCILMTVAGIGAGRNKFVTEKN